MSARDLQAAALMQGSSCRRWLSAAVMVMYCALAQRSPAVADVADAPNAVAIQWAVPVPLRDAIVLNATVYRPKGMQHH